MDSGVFITSFIIVIIRLARIIQGIAWIPSIKKLRTSSKSVMTQNVNNALLNKDHFFSSDCSIVLHSNVVHSRGNVWLPQRFAFFIRHERRNQGTLHIENMYLLIGVESGDLQSCGER